MVLISDQEVQTKLLSDLYRQQIEYFSSLKAQIEIPIKHVFNEKVYFFHNECFHTMLYSVYKFSQDLI